MRLPIVDSRTIPEELDYLHVWGIGPTAPLSRRLEVRPANDGVIVQLTAPDHVARHVALDAEFAGELASAARLLAGREDVPVTQPMPGRWHLVVELGWAGMQRRFELAQEPSEDALRAVVRRMSALLEGDGEIHLREVRRAEQ